MWGGGGGESGMLDRMVTFTKRTFENLSDTELYRLHLLSLDDGSRVLKGERVVLFPFSWKVMKLSGIRRLSSDLAGAEEKVDRWTARDLNFYGWEVFEIKEEISSVSQLATICRPASCDTFMRPYRARLMRIPPWHPESGVDWWVKPSPTVQLSLF